jgi:hypothetical protein
MKNVFEMMRKESAVDRFEVITLNLPVTIEKNHIKAVTSGQRLETGSY